jgi:branched-chain amino acid transport system permease protein
MELLIQTLATGILVGAFYSVMVLGFSVIWGVMGVLNVAHGELVMLGAYLAIELNARYGIDPFASLAIVMPVMFAVGWLLQLALINRVVERPHLVSLLVTFGLSILLASATKSLFGGDPRRIAVDYTSPLDVCGIALPRVRLLILGVALAIMGGLSLLLARTRLGKSIRAAAQNKNAARIVGIPIERVYAVTFGLCVAITAASGAMCATILPVHPFMGGPLTLKAFTITALGGLGRIPGALLGGVLLGVIEVGVATYVPGIGTNLGIATSFMLLVLVLVVRPQGLLRGLRPVGESDV